MSARKLVNKVIDLEGSVTCLPHCNFRVRYSCSFYFSESARVIRGILYLVDEQISCNSTKVLLCPDTAEAWPSALRLRSTIVDFLKAQAAAGIEDCQRAVRFLEEREAEQLAAEALARSSLRVAASDGQPFDPSEQETDTEDQL